MPLVGELLACEGTREPEVGGAVRILSISWQGLKVGRLVRTQCV